MVGRCKVSPTAQPMDSLGDCVVSGVCVCVKTENWMDSDLVASESAVGWDS